MLNYENLCGFILLAVLLTVLKKEPQALLLPLILQPRPSHRIARPAHIPHYSPL